MTPKEFIKLIDEEIAEGDRAQCKRIIDRKVSFEMFKEKILKKIGGSVD